ncbi:MAG: flagellar export protein FliJ [Bdellovibrionales bacterium]|nr:flagellar export protein FliJ [Bdellovibrionales bacterium]
MARFRFKFEAVGKLKKQKEQDALRLFGEAQGLLKAEIERREQLEFDLASALSRREALGETAVSPILFRTEEDFITGTKARIIQAQHAIERARRRVERAMMGYLVARRELLKVERLREKATADFKREQSKLEQKRLDDLYVMRARLNGNEEEGAA